MFECCSKNLRHRIQTWAYQLMCPWRYRVSHQSLLEVGIDNMEGLLTRWGGGGDDHRGRTMSGKNVRFPGNISHLNCNISQHFLCISLFQSHKFPSKWLNFPGTRFPSSPLFPAMGRTLILIYVSVSANVSVEVQNEPPKPAGSRYSWPCI